MNDCGGWVTLGEAAKRLGITRAAVYGRIERKILKIRPRGNRGLEVLWLGGDVTNDIRGDDALVGELRARIRALELEREALIQAGDRVVEERSEAQERA